MAQGQRKRNPVQVRPWRADLGVLIAGRYRARADMLATEGSDVRGTVYGAVDLACTWDVSAWEWCADVTPRSQPFLPVSQGFISLSDVPTGLHTLHVYAADPGVILNRIEIVGNMR